MRSPTAVPRTLQRTCRSLGGEGGGTKGGGEREPIEGGGGEGDGGGGGGSTGIGDGGGSTVQAERLSAGEHLPASETRRQDGHHHHLRTRTDRAERAGSDPVAYTQHTLNKYHQQQLETLIVYAFS